MSLGFFTKSLSKLYISFLSFLYVCMLILVVSLITPSVSYADTIRNVKVINFNPYDKLIGAEGDSDELMLSANLIITFDKEIIYDVSQYRRGLPFNIDIAGYSGKCVWNVVNERTINCPIYDPVLKPATNYTVTINKTLLPWVTLNKNYTFTFSTNRLSVEPSSVTVNNTLDKLAPVFSFYFNTPVNADNVSSNLEFVTNSANVKKGVPAVEAVKARVITSDGSLFYVSPIGKLAKNKIYDLVLNSGVIPYNGTLPSVRHSIYRYSTYDEPVLLYAFCSADQYYPRGIKRALTGRSGKSVTEANVKLDECNPDEKLVLIFSEPVKGVDYINDIKFKAINDVKTAFISENLKADTRYLFTLNSSIQSSFSSKNLANSYSITFATKSYPPMLYKWYQYAVLPKYMVDYGRNIMVQSANNTNNTTAYSSGVPISLRNVDNLSIIYHTFNQSDTKDSEPALYVARAAIVFSSSRSSSLLSDSNMLISFPIFANGQAVRNWYDNAHIANYTYYNERNKLYNSTVDVSTLLHNQSGVVEGLFNVNGEHSAHANNTNIYTTRGLATSGKFLYQVTPFQVFIKVGALRSVVWVLDTKTLQPVKGALVSLFINRDNVPPSDVEKTNTETDSNGIAYLPGRYSLLNYYGLFPDANYNDDFVNNEARDKYIYHIRVNKGEDVALLPISSSFVVNSGALAEENLEDSGLGFFGFTKNLVYKPGAVVNFNLFVRARELAYNTNLVFDRKNFVLPPENDTFVVTIVDSAFKTVAVIDNVTYDLSVDSGLINGMFNLPLNSTDGFYTAFISFKNDINLKDNETLFDVNPLNIKATKIFNFAVVNPDKLQTILSHKFDKDVISPEDNKLNVTTTLKFVDFANNSTVKKVNPENIVYTTAFVTPLTYNPRYNKEMLKGYLFPPYGEQYDVFYDTTKTLKETYSKEYTIPKKLAYGVLEVTSETRNDNAKAPIDKETEAVIDASLQNKYIESSIELFGTKTLLGINEDNKIHYTNRPLSNISILTINPLDEDNVIENIPLNVSLYYYDNNANNKAQAYKIEATCKGVVTKSIPVSLNDACVNDSSLVPNKVGVYKLVFNYTDIDGKFWGNEYKIYVTAKSFADVAENIGNNSSSNSTNNTSVNNNSNQNLAYGNISNIIQINNTKQGTFGFIFDKKEYQPGDNATILVSLPINTGLLFLNQSYGSSKNITIPLLITVENRDLISIQTANITINIDNISKLEADSKNSTFIVTKEPSASTNGTSSFGNYIVTKEPSASTNGTSSFGNYIVTKEPSASTNGTSSFGNYIVTKELKMPVTRSMFPSAYVSISVLSKDDVSRTSNGVIAAPEFITRYKKINVVKSQNDIALDVNINKYVRPVNDTNTSMLETKTANGEPLTEYTLSINATTFNNKTDSIVFTAVAVLNSTTTGISPSEGVFNPNALFKNTLRPLNTYSLLEQMLTKNTTSLVSRGLNKVDEYDGYKDAASMESEFNTINSIDGAVNDYSYQAPNLVPPSPDSTIAPLFIAASNDLLDTINNVQSKEAYKSSTLELFNTKKIDSDGKYIGTFRLPTIDYEVNWDIFIIAVDSNGNVGYVKKTINTRETINNENNTP